MRTLLRSIAMAFSMFSIIPMPKLEWEPENMRWALAALPLVGVVCGLALCGWYWLCGALGFGPVLYAAGIATIPLLVSVRIHMDGFCDTVDALASHAEPERRREILKDPHTGAFATISTVIFFVLYVALATELYTGWAIVIMLAIQQVLARTLGAFASVAFPKSGSHGTLFALSDASSKGSVAVLVIWIAACIAALIVISVPTGIVVGDIAVFCLVYLYWIATRKFGGMSGDLAGYLIMLSTLVMLVGTVVMEKVGLL